MRVAAAVLVGLWVAGCASTQPRTEVVLRVEADPAIRADASRLHILVRAGPNRSTASFAIRSDREYPDSGAIRFPFEVGLIPTDGDVGRVFEVTATARMGGTDIASGRVVSGYVNGMTLVTVLRLEDACRGVFCGADRTCRAGSCVDAFVEPNTLLPYTVDAGPVPPVDANGMDGSPTIDAPDAPGVDAGPAAPDAGAILLTEQARLLAADGQMVDLFGIAVALSSDGTRAVVGAEADDTIRGNNAGSARVFVRTGTTWEEEAALIPAAGAAEDNFGTAVAISGDGDRVLVGARSGGTAGTASVFLRTGTNWAEESVLAQSGGATGDTFGFSVALSSDGTRAVVGAPDDDTTGGLDAGSARIFARSGSTWSEEATLLAVDGNMGDRFGASVALSSDGRRALVGAPSDFTTAGTATGSGRIFLRTGTTWTEEATLLASGSGPSDMFDYAVALSADGTRALVGSRDSESPRVFVRSGTTWTEEASLVSATPGALGQSVTLNADGSRALVGAAGARVFTRTGTSWTEVGPLLPSGTEPSSFGHAVALSADGLYALVGAPHDPDGMMGPGSARAFALSP